MIDIEINQHDGGVEGSDLTQSYKNTKITINC